MERKQDHENIGLPLLLRVEAAAALLSLGRTKMYALIASGEVPVIRIGRSVRVPAAGLHRWVEQQTEQKLSAS